MTDSLFNKNDTPSGSNQDFNPDDMEGDEVNYVELLVGEGKKFKPLDDKDQLLNVLAKSKVKADEFIANLTREQEELRKELNTRLTLEQYLDRISDGSNKGENRPNPNEQNGFDEEDLPKQSLKAEDIEALIEKKVSERERQRIQAQNIAEVTNTLKQAFGNDYISKLKEASDTLGMTQEDFDQMAATRPKAFLKLIGADTPANRQVQQNTLFTPPSNQRSTGSFAPSGERTKTFYDQLKTKDPKGYWSPKVQNQMMNDAIKLGEKFFDTP